MLWILSALQHACCCCGVWCGLVVFRALVGYLFGCFGVTGRGEDDSWFVRMLLGPGLSSQEVDGCSSLISGCSDMESKSLRSFSFYIMVECARNNHAVSGRKFARVLPYSINIGTLTV